MQTLMEEITVTALVGVFVTLGVIGFTTVVGSAFFAGLQK